MESRTLACRIGAGLSTSPSACEAATEAARAARGGGSGRDAVNLAFLFLSPAHLDEVDERVPRVGGIAAGGGRPGAQALILDDAVHGEGAVGAVVSGPPVFTVVSQGCRPIGHEAVITHCEGNVVYELAGKPALERLR